LDQFVLQQRNHRHPTTEAEGAELEEEKDHGPQ
jgi:hypothetical protein